MTDRRTAHPRHAHYHASSDSSSSLHAHLQDDDDTIFALSSGSFSSSSAAAATAVAVVRVTGPGVRSTIVPNLLSSKAAAKLLVETDTAALIPKSQQQQSSSNSINNKARRATLVCKLYDLQKQPLDQAVVLYFQAPHSFTGQDVLELHTHGSRAVLRDLFDTLLALGARMAEPGEFTQRAFARGKLNVLQVEALADLLASDTQLQRKQALQQLDQGREYARVYDTWRQELIAGLAHAEAVIDFGDDERLDDDDMQESDTADGGDGGMSVWGNVIMRMQSLKESMQRQLQDGRRGELVRDGLQVAVVGPVNVGKSSLFNVLAQRDAAIVSSQAGTTRDVLEVTLNLGGVKVILQDTAGVRSFTTDEIELEGIQRAKRAAAQADVIIAMLDSTDVQTGLDNIMNVLPGRTKFMNSPAIPMLFVLNKSDLVTRREPPVAVLKDLVTAAGYDDCGSDAGNVFEISCVTQHGMDVFLQHLTSAVVQRVTGGDVLSDNDGAEMAQTVPLLEDSTLITRARHRQHIEAAVECLERFQIMARQGSMVVDLAAEELRLAASELGRITGAVDVEDVLDKLFSDFCIGK